MRHDDEVPQGAASDSRQPMGTKKATRESGYGWEFRHFSLTR